MGHYDRPDLLQHEQICALENAMKGVPHIAAFDLLTVAAVCLDDKAAVTWANAAAAGLLGRGDGLCHAGAGLMAAGPEANFALQRLIRRCAAGTGGALRLERPSGAAPLAAIAVPCRREPGRAWLFITDPQPAIAGEGRQAIRLAALYRLTAAEAAIALRIAAGNGLPAIAAALALSLSTIRTHTKHIFSKMQVHNQVQLARLIFQIGLFEN